MSEEASIEVAESGNPAVFELLSNHPRVRQVQHGSCTGVTFTQGVWEREVLVGHPEADLYGLIEIIDNNPLVCADRISVPGPAATLALIALAPLVHAGLIFDSPVLVLNFAADEQEVVQALAQVGWLEGVAMHCEEMDLGGVLAATVLVSILTPENLDDIDSLYEEHFGRSFYIRRDESSEWGAAAVLGKPYAAYRLRISPGQPQSLLTVQILSDPAGKCGACQIVHAMNVMCGFEESIGVS